MTWAGALAGLALVAAGGAAGFALCWRVVGWKVRAAEAHAARSLESLEKANAELAVHRQIESALRNARGVS